MKTTTAQEKAKKHLRELANAIPKQTPHAMVYGSSAVSHVIDRTRIYQA